MFLLSTHVFCTSCQALYQGSRRHLQTEKKRYHMNFLPSCHSVIAPQC